MRPGGGMGGGSGGGGRNSGGRRLDDLDFAELKSSRQRFDAYRERWKRTGPNDDHSRQDIKRDADGRPVGSTHRRGNLRRYGQWLRPFVGLITTVMIMGLVVAAMDVIWPLLIGDMINAISGDPQRYGLAEGLEPKAALGVLGAVCLAIIFGSRVLTFIRSVLIIRLSMQTAHRLRSQLFERFVRLSMTELHDLKSGGVISRLSTDVDNTSTLVQQGLISPLSAIVRLAVVIVVMLAISWQVTLVSMGLLIVFGLIYHGAMRRVRPVFRSMGKDRAGIDGRVGETFGGIRVVRAFAREQHEELDYGVGHHTVIRKQVWARMRMNGFHLFWDVLMPLVSLLVVWIGGLYILTTELTLGEVVAAQMLTFQVLGPVMMIVSSMTETQRGLAAMDRVYEILDKPGEKPDRPDALTASTTVDRLRFEQVWFDYADELKPRSGDDSDDSDDSGDRDKEAASDQPGTERWALRGVDLDVAGGSTVALVGHSGAGKTTIADLVARFHDPTRGAITLNGTDLRDYRLQSYRQLLGVVQQDTFLFDGTIRENIRYGRRAASDDEVIDAARRANCWEFIEPLEHGLDSVIGERGVKLSGGQRQRLSIARAILADPAILILDEATSNLDTESEQLIQASIDELLIGRTTFVIAHRLSTIRHADLIVVLDHGEIVERGDHDVLMALGGRYADMVRRQDGVH